MANLFLSCFFVGLTIFGLLAKAQTVQDDWVAPALPDDITDIFIGTTYTIQWDSNLYTWFPQFAPAANSSNCNLWVTGSSVNSSYQSLIQSNVDVQETTSVDWVVDISPSQLHNTTLYTFRFLPLGASYTDDQQSQISSPGVVIKLAASSSSSTSAAATTTPTTTQSMSTASGQTSTTTSVAATSTAATSNSSSGISGGAIAGIVIGAIAVFVLAGGVFVLWKLKSRGRTPSGAQTLLPTPAYAMTHVTDSNIKPQNDFSDGVQSPPGELEARNY